MQAVKFERDADGISVNIAVNEQFNGVLVESISMYVSTVNEDGYYYDGDLAVNWDTEGFSNNEAAATMGNLLLRDMRSEDDVTSIMKLFYWENAYTERLREILVAAGFSVEAADNVHTSEWGMQDEGRASYDAYSIMDEVRERFGITAAV